MSYNIPEDHHGPLPRKTFKASMPKIEVVVVRQTGDPEWLVCQAARGDYSKIPPWEMSLEDMMKTVKGNGLDEKKRTLLTKLLLSGHWGPWEHPTITFGISNMSRVTLAQLTRHRIASFDIQSQRYVKMSIATNAIPPSITADEVVSRQGGKREFKKSAADRLWLFQASLAKSYLAYQELIRAGVPAEDARYVLPNAQLIHGTMTVNARSLMHIIALRSFGDAQWEIKELADQLLELAKEWMPITFRLFETHQMKKRSVIAP